MRWIKLDFTWTYLKKLNCLIVALNLHIPFVAIELTAWIFFIFWHSKIHVNPISVISSHSPLQCHLSSSRRRHAIASCHTSFPWSQDELTGSASSFDNPSTRCLPFWAEIKVLNLHHHHHPPSPDHPTPIIHYYKKIISTLVTLPVTQPRLHFTHSVTRASHHRSSTHCHLSLSSSFLHTMTPTMMN
jgi:hypothetical protein